MSYQHFSAQEREKIAIGQAQGKNITEIARLLSRHKSSVSREITRNSGKRIYSGVEAQKIYSSHFPASLFLLGFLEQHFPE